LRKLQWKHAEKFAVVPRGIWEVDNTTAGYVKSAHGLSYLLVLGGSHLVPMDKPRETFDMLYRFMNHLPFADTTIDIGVTKQEALASRQNGERVLNPASSTTSTSTSTSTSSSTSAMINEVVQRVMDSKTKAKATKGQHEDKGAESGKKLEGSTKFDEPEMLMPMMNAANHTKDKDATTTKSNNNNDNNNDSNHIGTNTTAAEGKLKPATPTSPDSPVAQQNAKSGGVPWLLIVVVMGLLVGGYKFLRHVYEKDGYHQIPTSI